MKYYSFVISILAQRIYYEACQKRSIKLILSSNLVIFWHASSNSQKPKVV